MIVLLVYCMVFILYHAVFWTFSSDGWSCRLITDRSWVRVPEGPFWLSRKNQTKVCLEARRLEQLTLLSPLLVSGVRILLRQIGRVAPE